MCPLTKVSKRGGVPRLTFSSSLNVSFSDRQVKSLTNASVQFGVVPKDQWNPPHWINESRATTSRLDMAKNAVLYGGNLSLITSDVPRTNTPCRQSFVCASLSRSGAELEQLRE